mmetsp:Transcript_8607/g.24742  ORF Transcript_8607/g.24742 Transcript_8607/m.24742 type:complete len:308 (+) Transcript_8607:428-1351(+)
MLEVIVRPLALLDGWAALGPHRMWTPVSQPSPPFLQGVGQTFAVSETMNALKAEGKKALIPFLMAGDPNLETTAKALKILDSEGADVLELGVPYSDPLADGPTIQAAATRALLDQATTLDKVLDMLRGVKDEISAPVVLFCYYNPIMRRGLERFCQQAKAAGASGLLVPDIPLEETLEIKRVAREHGIELVLLATPTTKLERMKMIAEASSGFVYLVSVTGVTGVRTKVADRVADLVAQLKSVTDKPVAVGFGVSTAEDARRIVEMGGDGVICGSALVKALGEAGSPEEGLQTMTAIFKELRAATPK